MAQPAHPSGGRREPGRDPPRHRHRPGRRPRSRPRRGVGMSTDNHDEQDDEQGTALGARKGDAITEQQQKALDNQAKYDQMMRLADLFDASGDEMRTRAALGNQVLNEDRKSVGEGKRVSVRVELGGRPNIKKKTET